MKENTTMIGYMNQSIEDIKTIAEAKEVFYLSSPSSKNGKHTVQKVDKEGMEIYQIKGTSNSMRIHEIRHIGQSYSNGGMKFDNKGYLKTSAKSFSEGRAYEVEAYRVGYSYDTDSYPVPVKSVNEINEVNLMKILDDNGTPIYKALNVKDK